MSHMDDLVKNLCPNGVRYYKLSEIFDTRNGYTPSKSKPEYWKNGNVPWFRMEDIRENGTILSEAIQYVNECGVKGKLFPKNSLIVATSATIGEHALITVESLANQRFTYLMLKDEWKEKYDVMFLYYYCFKLDEWCLSHLNQGNFASVDMKQFAEFRFPAPPLEVQREIVQILDKFTLLSAELSAELSARQKQYEYYRDKLINGADGVQGKLIDMLEKPVTDGPHTTPKLYPNGIPFISATAVYDGKVHLEDMKGFISKEFDEECAKKYKPRKHDVFMVKSGSTTGKVAYVDFDDDFNVWSPIAAMRTNASCSSRYLYHLLQTTTIQNQVKERMSKGSQPNLSMRVIEQFDVVIPSLEEQEKIVNLLDKMDILCFGFKEGIPAEIDARQKQYEYYRDKLLTFKEVC